VACNLLIFNDPEIVLIGQERFFDSLAIYPSFASHQKQMRYGFHILNRDASLLSVIFKG